MEIPSEGENCATGAASATGSSEAMSPSVKRCLDEIATGIRCLRRQFRSCNYTADVQKGEGERRGLLQVPPGRARRTLAPIWTSSPTCCSDSPNSSNAIHASGEALFQATVTDVQVLNALEALGAKPGNNLPMETWDDRKDPHSKAPDMIIAGPAIDVLVRVPGRAEPLLLDQILTGKSGVDMRLGGHRANLPKWKSGCIASLYSCPGSKVGNAKATVRDYVRDPDRYQVRPGVLPVDGTGVTVVLRLAGAPR